MTRLLRIVTVSYIVTVAAAAVAATVAAAAVAPVAPEDQRERETKFDVDPAWRMPDDVTAQVPPGGRLARHTLQLRSRYYDTPDHDLLRSWLTLRRREGDADQGWQLKVPEDDGARTEVRLPLTGDEQVPAELLDLTLGACRGNTQAVAPIATLATTREVYSIMDANGEELAQVLDDVVTAVREGAGANATTVLQWRELEVELVTGGEKLLRRLEEWLLANGARPSASASKLGRALGQPPRPERDVSTLHGLVGAYLDSQFVHMLRGDVFLRRDLGAVHATRTATRRYRSVLREFGLRKSGGGLYDPQRSGALERELAWFADLLGTARDQEVMGDKLDKELESALAPGAWDGARALIHARLDRDHGAAAVRLAEAMRGERYFSLLRELRAWFEAPAAVLARAGEGASGNAAAATAAPASQVSAFLHRAERRVHRRLQRAAEVDRSDVRAQDVALHRARKAAKRARYVGEAAQPALSKRRGSAAVRENEALQNELGQRQDDVVAAAFLAEVAGGEPAFALGVLHERARQRAGRWNAGRAGGSRRR